jgi:hypothetical protein
MNMHADENSDGVIVPEKRSNNEGVSSAETVEGRTSPKGNGGRTAAARTLRRDTASNGLIAVRRAARQSKSVRFTALLHHITIDLLKQSYLSLERDSAPGIDGVTWQTYGENLEDTIVELSPLVVELRRNGLLGSETIKEIVLRLGTVRKLEERVRDLEAPVAADLEAQRRVVTQAVRKPNLIWS